MPRNSQRSVRADFQLKSDLQRRRDHFSFKISKKWRPQSGRPNRGPQGFRSIAGANDSHAQRCYQNVAHQALMHTAIFVQWIRTHKPHDHNNVNCIMCLYKDLAQRYWDDPTNLVAAFLPNDPAVLKIANAAAVANPVSFGHGLSGDASEFYEWVTDQLHYPVPIPPAQQGFAEHWNEEKTALFRLDYDCETTCQTCYRVQDLSGYTEMISVPILPGMNLRDILDQEYFREQQVLRCPSATCLNNQQTHNVQRKIIAAPQVLRIYVDILQSDNGNLAKIMYNFNVDRTLDLKTFQLHAGLPLDYELTSAIAHGGGTGFDLAIYLSEDNESSDASGEEVADDPEEVPDEEADGSVETPEEEVDELVEDRAAELAPHRRNNEERILEHFDDPAFRHSDDLEIRNDMSNFNGLVEVTEARFLEELGPDLDHLPPDSLMREAGDEWEDQSEGMAVELTALNRAYTPSTSSGKSKEEDDDHDDDHDSDATISIEDMDDHIGYLPQVNHHNNDGAPQGDLEDESNDGDDEDDEDYLYSDSEEDNSEENNSEEDAALPGHYIINVQGPDNCHHVSENHSNQLAANLLTENPQQPTDTTCQRAAGYQVVVLTYTRKSLTGRAGKQERDLIPPWSNR